MKKYKTISIKNINIDYLAPRTDHKPWFLHKKIKSEILSNLCNFVFIIRYL